MPRGAVLTNDVKKLIFEVYNADRTQRAKEVRDEVHKRLGRDDWPKLSVIQREIKTIEDNRRKMIESGGIDFETPWHLGLMRKRKYDIDAAAVPYIVYVQNWAKKHGRDEVTVSQARWIAHLYAFLSPGLKKSKDIQDELSWLWNWSRLYMLEEAASDLIGAELFNTSELDKMLMEPVHFKASDDTSIAFFKDRSFFIATKDKNLRQQLNEKESEQ